MHLAEHHERFRRIVKAKKLRTLMGDLHGNQLSRVPKGFPAEHQASDLLRYKQWLFYAMLDPALATTPKLPGEIRKRFEVMMPFLDFLNASLLKIRRPLP